MQFQLNSFYIIDIKKKKITKIEQNERTKIGKTRNQIK